MNNLANPKLTQPRRLHYPRHPDPFASDERRAVYLAELSAYRDQQAILRAGRFASYNAERRHRQTVHETVTLPRWYEADQVKTWRDTHNLAPWTASLDGIETIRSERGQDAFIRLNRSRWQVGGDLAITAQSAYEEHIGAEVLACGSRVWVAIGPDGPTTIRERCHRRACPYCEAMRGFQITGAAECLLNSYNRPKFVTLTVKPRALTLRAQVQRVLSEFARLRATRLWKDHVRGGLYVVEIKRHPQRLHWHVHIHAIIDAKYLDQRALSETWHRITTDSSVVHIEAANPQHAKYVGKYVGKGNSPDCEPWEHWAYLHEVEGLRLAATFGNAPSLTALKPAPTHTLIAPLDVVQAWANSGDPKARVMLDIIAERLLETERRTEPGQARPPTAPNP